MLCNAYDKINIKQFFKWLLTNFFCKLVCQVYRKDECTALTSTLSRLQVEGAACTRRILMCHSETPVSANYSSDASGTSSTSIFSLFVA